MRRAHFLLLCAVATAAIGVAADRAWARGPRNPYSSFNLSGVNYGAMQWERAQQQGRRVWPYYNTPSRSTAVSRGGTVAGGFVGGGGGGAVMTSRSAPRGLLGRRR
jgi:hypothetical protein